MNQQKIAYLLGNGGAFKSTAKDFVQTSEDQNANITAHKIKTCHS